jgi:hypothetical protein
LDSNEYRDEFDLFDIEQHFTELDLKAQDDYQTVTIGDLDRIDWLIDTVKEQQKEKEVLTSLIKKHYQNISEIKEGEIRDEETAKTSGGFIDSRVYEHGKYVALWIKLDLENIFRDCKFIKLEEETIGGEKGRK